MARTFRRVHRKSVGGKSRRSSKKQRTSLSRARSSLRRAKNANFFTRDNKKIKALEKRIKELKKNLDKKNPSSKELTAIIGGTVVVLASLVGLIAAYRNGYVSKDALENLETQAGDLAGRATTAAGKAGSKISAPVKYAFAAACKAAGYDSKTQKIDEKKVDVKAVNKQKMKKVLREFYDTKPVPQNMWSTPVWWLRKSRFWDMQPYEYN